MSTCPEWVSDTHNSQKHENGALRLLEEEYQATPFYVPTVTMFERWHHLMFRGSVPLPYYAGGIRQDDPVRPCLAQQVVVEGQPGSPYQTAKSDLENVVADGVVFPDGAAVLRWRGDFSSTGVYASLHQLVSVHGHANTSFFRTCVVNEALIKSKTQNWYQDWCEGVPASGDGPNAQYFAGERDAVLSLMKRVPLDAKQPDKLENSRG